MCHQNRCSEPGHLKILISHGACGVWSGHRKTVGANDQNWGARAE